MFSFSMTHIYSEAVTFTAGSQLTNTTLHTNSDDLLAGPSPVRECGDMYANQTCCPDKTARSIQALLSAISMLLIFVGNGLTILVIVLDRQLHKTSFLVILNLAITDFLLGVVSLPPSIYYVITCVWPGGTDEGFLCQFVGFAICLLSSVSILSLGFVSYERYVYVVCPFEYRQKMSIRRMLFVCSLLWCYSAAAAALPISGLWRGVGLQPDAALCNIRWQSKPLYMWGMIMLVLVPSCVITVYSYSKIVYMARMITNVEAGHRRAIELNKVTPCPVPQDDEYQTNDGISTDTNFSQDGTTINKLHSQPQQLRKVSVGNARKVAKIFVRERKSTITVTVLIGTFFVCWTPYVIVNVFQVTQCKLNSFWANAITQWLCIFNSACNPFVYGLTNKVFRDAVKRFVRRRCGLACRSTEEDRRRQLDGERTGGLKRSELSKNRLEEIRLQSQEELDSFS